LNQSAQRVHVAIINLLERFQILSSAALGGGFTFSNTFIILQVPNNYDSTRPEEDLLKICQKLGLNNEYLDEDYLITENLDFAINVNTPRDLEMVTKMLKRRFRYLSGGN